VVPVARLAVPRLGEEAVVLGGTSGQALAFGPGHLDGSAAVGAPGTAILAGHRDTHFRFLADLMPGDRIVAQAAGGAPVTYRVVATEVVAARTSGLDPADGGPTGARLALVTCWPLDGLARGPLRYVVLAEREPAILLAAAGR
jgi:sortase A